jgi:hypothetical protein
MGRTVRMKPLEPLKIGTDDLWHAKCKGLFEGPENRVRKPD